MTKYFLDLIGKHFYVYVSFSCERMLLLYLSVVLSAFTVAPGLVMCMLE